MPPDDVLLQKGAIVERSLRRVAQELAADPSLGNYTHVDAMTLNVERACQATIDMAMHVVARQHLGMPQSSGDAFDLLARAQLIPTELSGRLKGMVGFRNVAVHQYQELDLDILRSVATSGVKDLVEFCAAVSVRIVP